MCPLASGRCPGGRSGKAGVREHGVLFPAEQVESGSRQFAQRLGRAEPRLRNFPLSVANISILAQGNRRDGGSRHFQIVFGGEEYLEPADPCRNRNRFKPFNTLVCIERVISLRREGRDTTADIPS